MSRAPSNVTTTQQLDPAAEAYRNDVMNAARVAAGMPVYNANGAPTGAAGATGGARRTGFENGPMGPAMERDRAAATTARNGSFANGWRPTGSLELANPAGGGMSRMDMRAGDTMPAGPEMTLWGGQQMNASGGPAVPGGRAGSPYGGSPYGMPGRAGGPGDGAAGLPFYGASGNMGAPGSAGTYGLTPEQIAAAQNWGGYANAGNLGLGALSGNQGAVDQLMNPYLNNVVDATRGDYDNLRARTSQGINDQATAARAFGGSRHGVAEGVALGEVGRAEGSTLAGLRYQGFNDAMGRAGSLANLGMQANGELANFGDYRRRLAESNDPALRRLAILQGAAGLPSGTTTSQPVYQNRGAGFLGGAATGAGIGGQLSGGNPWGVGIGAGIGGIVGLFG